MNNVAYKFLDIENACEAEEIQVESTRVKYLFLEYSNPSEENK